MDHKIILFAVIILFYFLLMMRSIKFALLVYLVLCPFNIFIPIGFKNINSTEAVALMFIVVWLFGLLRKERPWIPDTVFTIPLFFYFFVSLIMLISTGLTGEVILSIVRHFQFFGVFMIFVTYFQDRTDIEKISNALILSMALLCFISIIEYIFVWVGHSVAWQRSILWKEILMDIGFYPGAELAIRRLVSASGKAGIAAVFPFSSSFGIYLGSLIYLLAWKTYLYNKQNMKKIGMVLLLLISIAILIFTKGRTAIFAFLFSIPLIVMFLRNWKLGFKIISIFAVGIILIFAFIPAKFLDQSVEWVEILGTKGFEGLGEGDTNRIDYFLGSVNLFLKHPLTGVDPSTYKKEINPHSAITQALVSKGIFGGITLLWVLIRMFSVSRRHLQNLGHKNADRERFLALGWLLSLAIYFCVQSIGVVLFGYVLTCIPAIAAMTMFVISRKPFVAEESPDIG